MKKLMLLFSIASMASNVASAGYTINPNNHAIRGRLWTSGIVPYEVDPTLGSATINNIKLAVLDYNTKTTIRWVPRTYEVDYVSFDFTTMNAAGSSLGMQLGKQSIKVHQNEGIGTLIHEMGHTVGLYHEFANPDMLKWVVYIGNDNNAGDKFCKDYFLGAVTPGVGINKYYMWDTESIMNYAHGCFLNQNAPLKVKSTYPGSKKVYPPNWKLSKGDVVTINSLYKEINFPVQNYKKCVDETSAGYCMDMRARGDCESYSMSIIAYSYCRYTCGICKSNTVLDPIQEMQDEDN